MSLRNSIAASSGLGAGTGGTGLTAGVAPLLVTVGGPGLTIGLVAPPPFLEGGLVYACVALLVLLLGGGTLLEVEHAPVSRVVRARARTQLE